ncbi:hypothetical protein LUZ60_016478 [Juncus effusus]|nr:hypothetical protein LUZ60_016478 [Juncus effusus]
MRCTIRFPNYSHLLILILLLTIPNIIESMTNTLPGCPDRCGNIMVPYPFGIGTECSFKGFTLNCTTYQNGTSKLFLNRIEFLSISLLTAEARINNHVSWQCYNNTANKVTHSDWWMNLMSSPYRFSDSRNKFITIGCETLAYIGISNNVNNY